MSLFPANNFPLIGVILALPLFGAFFNGIWGKRLGNSAVRLMALAAIGGSLLAALVTFFALVSHVDAEKHEHVKLAWTAWNWMHTTGGRSGGARVPIDARFSVDALSGVMMLVVTGVGFLIHLYSTAYMENDPGFARFFAYLNLFVFAMLVLILADNLPLLFVGWEGVGLCSYLLIGFWYEKMPNAAAGKKAFIANRVGDFGLICGMFLLVWYTGALDWDGIKQGAGSLMDSTSPDMPIHVWPVGGGVYEGFFHWLQPDHPLTISAATAVGLALLLGCTGKSAQIPLYVWLPDAMAGPTPVSALIHAATMVTAGVYLICRLSFVFVMSPFVMMIIAVIGAGTALFAATIALVQNDIKKVLAYSTISQLGFMFLGVGVGAFTAGFFHVFTHAFFKACLFLCAGSVIHAMHARIHDDEKAQDMRYMGGLRKYMPMTYWSFMAATLAIAGCPGTSGFFSKDEILYRSWVDSSVNPFKAQLEMQHLDVWAPPQWLGPVLFMVALAAAVMTAFYMFRALFLTFWGDFRGWTIGRPSLLAASEVAHEDGHEHHEDLSSPGYPPRESPWQMWVPLVILATCSIVAGFIFNAGPIPVAALHSMDHWLDPVFEPAAKAIVLSDNHETMALVLLVPGIAAFLFGSGAAWWMYIAQKGALARQAADAAPALHRILLNKWYVDEIYDVIVVSAVDALADTSAAFDQTIVDGLIAKLPALLTAIFGSILRAFQTGVVHVYAAFMAIGLAGFGWFFLVPHPATTVAETRGDYVVTVAPGMGYAYRWDADGNGQFDSEHTSDLTSVKVHLEEGETKTILVEATNAFGMTAQAAVPLTRAKAKPMQLGQN